MGIRFYCPQGHKLNVKSFLAGKKGFCPHCNAKVDIPLRSTRPSSKEDKQKSVPSVMSVPLAGPAGGVATVTTDAPLARPVAAPTGAAPMALPLSSPSARPAAPEPAATATAGAMPKMLGMMPTVPTSGLVPAVPTAPSPATTAASTSNATATPALSDPINEAPHAVWYVRPALGGQYGPAAGEMLRQWMQQGRVASDSLVWREGWPNWHPAGSVFPQLTQSPSLPGLPEGLQVDLQLPLDPLTLPASGSLGRPISRKPTSMMITLIVGLLVVVALGLAGVLMLILSNR